MCFLELESDVGEKKTAWDGSKVFVFEVGRGRHGRGRGRTAGLDPPVVEGRLDP